MISHRLSTATNRKTLLTKYGYDTKFASHLVRLMLEGKELLETGSIQFPLKERNLVLDIKLGKYKMHEVLDISDEFEREIESLAISSKLSKKPKYNDIQELIKKMLKKFLFKL